ncbi:MAG: hypothetical protein NC452_06065 [Eubacterium sp.]|nr:hypothetical protein [Eubacterium sp.]
MMIDREKKISEELSGCRKSISRTKNLIDYHKAILKNLESKEKALSERLEKEKFSSFYRLLSEQGYDIDALKNAALNGEFEKLFSNKSEENAREIPAEKEKNIDNEKEISEDEKE